MMGQRPAGMSVGSVAFNLLTDIPGPRCPEESLKTHSSICVFLGYFGAVFVFDPQGCDSPLSVKVRRRWCLCRGVSLNTEILSIYSCVCVCETNVCLREKVQSVLCWRMSVKKEPGSSLDQPFRGKRTHAVFLFGRGWLYEFIMPLVEHSSKNQHWNPPPTTPCPPANPSIGPTFIILTFPLQGSDIKVDPPLIPL